MYYNQQPKQRKQESSGISGYVDQLFGTDGKIHGQPLMGNVRLQFIRKVFGIVFVQLLATTAMTVYVCQHPSLGLWMATNAPL